MLQGAVDGAQVEFLYLFEGLLAFLLEVLHLFFAVLELFVELLNLLAERCVFLGEDKVWLLVGQELIPEIICIFIGGEEFSSLMWLADKCELIFVL